MTGSVRCVECRRRAQASQSFEVGVGGYRLGICNGCASRYPSMQAIFAALVNRLTSRQEPEVVPVPVDH